MKTKLAIELIKLGASSEVRGDGKNLLVISDVSIFFIENGKLHFNKGNKSYVIENWFNEAAAVALIQNGKMNLQIII